MAQGYIKLHRSLTENWLWEDKPFSYGQAWIDLLLLAEHKEHKRIYKGQLKTYEAGTVNLSITALAKRWGWTWRKAKAFLQALEADDMCRTNSTTNDTVVTIVKWAFFQNQNEKVQNEQQSECHNECHNESHNECHISKNDKNVKNEKKYIYKPAAARSPSFMDRLDEMIVEGKEKRDGENEELRSDDEAAT